MVNIMRLRYQLALFILASSAITSSALGQTRAFPNKPIRMLVGYEPGGPNDTQARLIGPKIAESLEQQVIVENRPGGDGVIAGEMVAKSAPDGHTMILISAGHSIMPNFIKIPYHPLHDFSPIAQVSSSPYFLVVHPSLPVQSTQALIQYAKSKPGELNYGSSGTAGALMMAMELFNGMNGLKINHIPYKGAAPATADLIAGRIQVMMNNAVSSLPNARAGKLRVLAVTSPSRSPATPDIPALSESVPGYSAESWYGVLAAHATPAPIVNRLNAAIVRALTLPDIRERFSALGLQPVGGTSEQWTALIQNELLKWAKLVKENGITAN